MTGVDAMLRRRRRLRNRRLATAAVVACAAGALVMAMSRSSEPGTPTEAVQQYVDAVVSEDFERAWKLTCETKQRAAGSKADFTSAEGHPRFRVEGGRIAGEAVPFEPFPIEAWRVGYYREEDAGPSAKKLVIRENGQLRVCGDPRYLYEMRAGIP